MRRFTLAASAAALALSAGVLALPAQADQHMKGWTVDLNEVTDDGVGDKMGTVTIMAAEGGGTSFTVRAEGFEPGEHGFHVHENASCQPSQNDQGEVVPGGAAGSHWDPEGTGTHRGPTGDGHLGDLPALEADEDGSIDQVVTAPRIDDMSRLAEHALIVHAGGDTYSDEPSLGGGGARVACALIPAQQEQ
ncbi:Superoxide dismutase [Cu-Zn] precursor [Caenispirillum salinarum AK4]|uniref:Superoxide dismutase [Cu-Zn] n=1 Tax=Caenispirillum salinarum AK4 TaxID=1238182 RepID=K9H2D6_9PROT|nr:superoxide dismutase family protein [Caenispirillum salinarum]EKV31727.1 Superoxide dismutase [Cu-Zn] precursor [Caenispirillum salinarum AK4]